MMLARHVRRRRLVLSAAVLAAAVALLQVANTLSVRAKLCDQPSAREGCPAVGGPGSLVFAPAGHRVAVTTWLVRRTCGARWTLAAGGRADVPAMTVGTRLGALELRDACVWADRARMDGVVREARLTTAGCGVRFAPFKFTADGALTAAAEARLDARTSEACTALLSDAAPPAVARALADARLRVAVRYDTSARAASVADVLTEAVARREARHALTRLRTSHRVDVALGRETGTLRLESAPAGASADMRLTVRASEALAALVPADVRRAAGPLALDLRWDLGHASGVVRVNGRDERRRPASPTRAAGRLELPPSECGPPGPAARALFFVEADDRGRALLPAQAEAARAAVDSAMRAGGALVTVFVHGWQHSAAPGDSYACRFADIVASIGAMETRAAAIMGRSARRVVGVYVGWPGALYEDGLANTVTTFWNRLHAADSLGARGGMLHPLLAGLAERVAAGRREPRADRRSSLVVVGHSMGARAVFNALRADLLAGRAAASAAPDLTLLVNPAFSADLYRAVHDRTHECAPSMAPVLLFSSEADAVTRKVYPAGQAVTYTSAAAQPTPFLEHVYTAANFAEFVTHRLVLEPAGGPPPQPEGPQTILRGFERIPAGSRELYSDNPVVVYRQPAVGRPRPADVWYRLRLSPLPGVRECGAPWARSAVVAVDPRVLPDHGRIFTPPFVEYIARVLNAQASAARPVGS